MAKTPDYRITVDGEDITARIQGRLISLTLRDTAGIESDQLDLEVTDHDGKLNLPRKGAIIRLSLGYVGTPLINKGRYIVDEVEHAGPPDKITIRARGANFRSVLKVKQTRSWHQTTVGDLVRTIASAYDLESAIAATLDTIVIDHLDQTTESDANLLTRLGRLHGAIATIKDGRLLFTPRGKSATTSGNQLPTITIARSDGNSHRYTAADRGGNFTGVKTTWHDVAAAVQKGYIAGEDGVLKTLRQPYPTEAEATAAAEAEWSAIQRAGAEMSLTLADGRPELIPETPVVLEGWKLQVIAEGWVVKELSHTLAGSGLVTSVEMGIKG